MKCNGSNFDGIRCEGEAVRFYSYIMIHSSGVEPIHKLIAYCPFCSDLFLPKILSDNRVSKCVSIGADKYLVLEVMLA